MQETLLAIDTELTPDLVRLAEVISTPEIIINEFPIVLDNEINGTNNSETLEGDRRANEINGRGGDDTISGLGGTDFLSGGSGNDEIFGGNKADRLFGDSGDDRLNGDNGDDILYGGAGRDTLRGGNGNDVLIGNQGDDNLYGDAGHDAFILQVNAGTDVIRNFTQGEDRLGLPEGVTFTDLTITACTCGTRAFVKLGEQTLAKLIGVDPTQVDAADFAPVIRAL
jgi:Ca2+-binding RTX toxin-like protein